MSEEYLAKALNAEKHERLSHFRCSKSHCLNVGSKRKE